MRRSIEDNLLASLQKEHAKSYQVEKKLAARELLNVTLERAKICGIVVGACVLLAMCAKAVNDLTRQTTPSTSVQFSKDSNTYGWYGNQRITQREFEQHRDFLEKQGLPPQEGRRALDQFIDKR